MNSTTKKDKYIIGTRGSLLALTQAGQVKKLLEDRTGCDFEFKVITTQGDQVTDKALWQLEGKDFFTKELDHALLAKDIDLVIHSYKDLGSDRPDGINLAAITKRQFPQDILLISNDTIKRLKDWPADKPFIVGTSAPRRITNIESSLAEFLPGNDIKVECRTLRGNVNSRIEKLHNEGYDAIILALAGLERLAITTESAKTLTSLLSGLNFKVLPLTHFPPAASQGALAIEAHEDSKELIELIQCVHDQKSADSIAKEREVFTSFGGGCHLALGIHVTQWNDFFLKFQKGCVDGKDIWEKKILNSSTIKPVKPDELFIGFPQTQNKNQDIAWDHLSIKNDLPSPSGEFQHLFVTSSYCLKTLDSLKYSGSLWAAGHSTHNKLAKAGYWVCADSDSLGISQIDELTSSLAIQIICGENKTLSVLTERNSEYTQHQVIPCYSREFNEPTADFLQELSSKKNFYWGSYPQFLHYASLLPRLKTDTTITHYCGLGKTFTKLKQEPIKLFPVMSAEDLYEL